MMFRWPFALSSSYPLLFLLAFFFFFFFFFGFSYSESEVRGTRNFSHDWHGRSLSALPA